MDWYKSTYCEGGSCVEVAAADGVSVRDMKHQVMTVTPAAWAAFVADVKSD